MITKEYLKQLVENRLNEAKNEDSHYGSLPKSLFNEDGAFNKDNWNGGDDIIRQFTRELEWDEPYTKEFEIEYNSSNYIMNISGDLIAVHSGFSDQNYIQITTYSQAHIEELDNYSEWKFDQYLVTYYKSRGKTELILKNGKPININEYVELLQIIESSGYKFNN